jgi:hypothetical protein
MVPVAKHLILPRHNIMNNVARHSDGDHCNIETASWSGGVSIFEITYTPGDYGDITQILEMYKKTSVPNKFFAITEKEQWANRGDRDFRKYVKEVIVDFLPNHSR